jgi:Skp family chaperone for outer membrane proteins
MKGLLAMRSVVIAASTAFVLSAAPGFAQAPVAPRPAAPAAQAPAAPPAAAPAPTPAPAPAPPAPFPQGSKIGLVNLQQIASLSADGKSSTARVQALITKKQNEAAAKAKQLQDNQTRLQQSGALMNDAARSQLEKDIERQTLEEQRFQQDAQAEINELQTELQTDFQKKLFPVLIQLSQEKGLHLLLSQADAGIIWWEPGIDLTLEAVKRFDALGPSAPAAATPAARPPAARPPAAPAAPAAPKP